MIHDLCADLLGQVVGFMSPRERLCLAQTCKGFCVCFSLDIPEGAIPITRPEFLHFSWSETTPHGYVYVQSCAPYTTPPMAMETPAEFVWTWVRQSHEARDNYREQCWDLLCNDLMWHMEESAVLVLARLIATCAHACCSRWCRYCIYRYGQYALKMAVYLHRKKIVQWFKEDCPDVWAMLNHTFKNDAARLCA